MCEFVVEAFSSRIDKEGLKRILEISQTDPKCKLKIPESKLYLHFNVSPIKVIVGLSPVSLLTVLG